MRISRRRTCGWAFPRPGRRLWRRNYDLTEEDVGCDEARSSVRPNCGDVALEVQSDLWILRNARIVRDVRGSGEGRAAIGGTAKENIQIAGADVLPNDVNVPVQVRGDLWSRRSRIVREVLSGKCGASVAGTAEEDVDSGLAGDALLPDHVDVAARIQGDLL